MKDHAIVFLIGKGQWHTQLFARFYKNVCHDRFGKAAWFIELNDNKLGFQSLFNDAMYFTMISCHT